MARPVITGGFAGDLRCALRSSWRTPGVTVAALLALAVGIGANTAIFSVVDGVLLRPLPFPDPDRLFQVYMGSARHNQGRYNDPLSYPQYQDLVTHSRALESLGGWTNGEGNLWQGDTTERVLLRFALPSLLPTLRVQPVRGRNFLPDETIEGRHRVALISYGMWQRQFAGADSAIGQALRIDGIDHRIVGILPADFQLENEVDLWLPLVTSTPAVQVRNAHFLSVVGRIRPGATPAAMDDDLQMLARLQTGNFPDMFPASFRLGFQAQPLLDAMVTGVRLPLLILLGAVVFVLLITCATVANLLLARAAARERELAIRKALGAGRGRLIRQLLTESLLLSLAGGGLGVGLAIWGIDALLALSPDSLPRVSNVGLDWRVLAFTAAVATATGIAFGLAPAIAQSRPDVHGALKEGMFGTSSGGGRLRKGLVVGQVAICLILLVGAGLLLQSFLRLQDIHPGFRPEQALTFRVSLPRPDGQPTEQDGDRFVGFFRRATERLRQLPGVSAVGASNIVPLDGRRGSGRLIEIEGYVPRDSGEMPSAQNRQATPGWFAAIGIPLRSGRIIAESDDAAAPRVVVVNESFVRRYFPDGHAIGKRIRLGKLTEEFPWATIVGVVGDVRSASLAAPARPEMYWPLAQNRTASNLAIVVRTMGDPLVLVGPVRAAMRELSPTQPISRLQTVEELVSASLGHRRFTLTLMLAFGIVALALAAVGIYGVVAYNVAQRTREIGIRVALGARPATVLAMVVTNGMSLVAVGIAVGIVGALAASRLATSLLYGVSPSDAGTYVAIAAALGAVALLAMLLPARRAIRVDPMRALRAE